jgi:hypothetical protein
MPDFEIPEDDGREKPEAKEKDDFELMSEGDENIRQLDFNSILFRQVDRIARYGTEGQLGSFGNGVSLFDALLTSMKDSQFEKDSAAIETKYDNLFKSLEERRGEADANGRTIDTAQMAAHFMSEKNLERMRLLLGLLGKKKRI